MQRPIPFLRSLAAILAGIVVLRIGYEPRIVGDAVGTTPIFNWLLWGYGIPALSFWAAASSCAAAATMRRCARWNRPRSCSRCCWRSWKSAMPSTAATSIASSAGLTEVALQVCVALAMAIGLERLRHPHRQHRSQCRRGAAHGRLPALAAVFGLMVLENPMLWPIDVGGVFINLLLLAMPCPRCWRCCCPMRWRAGVRAAYANTIAAGALVLALTYVTFEIRRLYHGPVLTGGADHRRRAIHLFDRLARVRRGAARHRHSLQLAARAARVRRRDRAYDPEGVPDRHVDADRRLPRAVVHVPRAWCWWRSAGCTSGSCSAGKQRRRRSPRPHRRELV